MAHEIELIIRANVPTGLKSPDPIDGATSNIRPPNPAANPIIVAFVMDGPIAPFFIHL